MTVIPAIQEAEVRDLDNCEIWCPKQQQQQQYFLKELWIQRTALSGFNPE